MKLFVNPYSGKLMDLDQVPLPPGGAKWCPDTGRPLNAEAVEQWSYPGPAEDRESWKQEELERVKAIEAQAEEPKETTLGISPSLPMNTQPSSPPTPVMPQPNDGAQK